MLPFGIAHQSERTKPWNPNSVRSMSVSRCVFCVECAFAVSTWLYAAMTDETPPSWTIISKWRP